MRVLNCVIVHCIAISSILCIFLGMFDAIMVFCVFFCGYQLEKKFLVFSGFPERPRINDKLILCTRSLWLALLHICPILRLLSISGKFLGTCNDERIFPFPFSLRNYALPCNFPLFSRAVFLVVDIFLKVFPFK